MTRSRVLPARGHHEATPLIGHSQAHSDIVLMGHHLMPTIASTFQQMTTMPSYDDLVGVGGCKKNEEE